MTKDQQEAFRKMAHRCDTFCEKFADAYPEGALVLCAALDTNTKNASAVLSAQGDPADCISLLGMAVAELIRTTWEERSENTDVTEEELRDAYLDLLMKSIEYSSAKMRHESAESGKEEHKSEENQGY